MRTIANEGYWKNVNVTVIPTTTVVELNYLFAMHTTPAMKGFCQITREVVEP